MLCCGETMVTWRMRACGIFEALVFCLALLLALSAQAGDGESSENDVWPEINLWIRLTGPHFDYTINEFISVRSGYRYTPFRVDEHVNAFGLVVNLFFSL